MNLTRAVLQFIASELRHEAEREIQGHVLDRERYDTLVDAADALDDAVDMLAELGEL